MTTERPKSEPTPNATEGHRRPPLWFLPNVVTLVRLALLPVFAVLIMMEFLTAGLIVLLVIGLSDFGDGVLARRLHASSRFGRLMDPIADRLALLVVSASFAASDLIPWWMFVALIVPDLILLMLSRGKNPPDVNWIGKVRTALLLVGFPAVLTGHVFGLPWLTSVGSLALIVGTVGHLVAAVGYGYQIVTRKPHPDKPGTRLNG